MSKRFTWVVGALAGLVALAACSSGSGNEGNPEPGIEGEAQVSVKGLSAYEIQSMVVTAHPAGTTKALAYSPDAGTFTGTLVLPTGTQTLTANGYAYVYSSDGGTPDGGPFQDAGTTSGLTLVASGTATATITANTTTAVAMRIYDLTPPRPQPDIAPYIHSVTASRTNVQVNESVALSVVAEDLDGDALSYLWTSDCASGSFSNRTAATTSWASSTPGACNISVAVTARGQTVTDSQLSVVVFAGGPDAGTGGAQVNGEYIPRPMVYGISLFNSSGTIPYSTVSRYGSAANLPAVRPGQQYYLELSIEYGTRLGARSSNLMVSCGSLVKNYDTCDVNASCYGNYTWTTPAAGTLPMACKVTGTATNETLVDGFSAGVVVR
jgi:hypothetical protein